MTVMKHIFFLFFMNVKIHNDSKIIRNLHVFHVVYKKYSTNKYKKYLWQVNNKQILIVKPTCSCKHYKYASK